MSSKGERASSMCKLVSRHRNSVGDVEALVRPSSHGIVFRAVVHSLLCVAALILGFSISREAVLIVISFRLPNGSLFVKTTTSPLGHEVAIISFPRMQQSHTFSESKFSVSRAEMRFTHPKEQSLEELDAGAPAQGDSLAFSESKISLHHTNTHVTSFQPPHATIIPKTESLKSSRVSVGRHEILIRAWPHPDPLQIVNAHQIMRLVQEEQQHEHGQNDRKQLLIITATHAGTFQLARLTCLIHTLRLVPGPLLWIVVEAGNNISNDAAAVLASSTLAFRHLGLQEATTTSTHLKAHLQTEGLRYIREHRLEGVVVFADDSITYNLNFFDEVQKVKWFGSFSTSASHCSYTQGDAQSVDMQHGHLRLISSATNQSASPMSHQGPCNSSTHIVYWYFLMRNESKQGIASMGSLDWSNFALNARVLWQNPEVSWIKGWNEIVGGNRTFVQNPLMFVKNTTCMESLG